MLYGNVIVNWQWLWFCGDNCLRNSWSSFKSVDGSGTFISILPIMGGFNLYTGPEAFKMVTNNRSYRSLGSLAVNFSPGNFILLVENSLSALSLIGIAEVLWFNQVFS